MKRAFVACGTALLVAMFLALPRLSVADVPQNMQAGSQHAPPAVTNLQAHRGGPNTISLTWNAASQSNYRITSVTVQRTHGRSPIITVTLGPAQRWSDTNAVAGTNYHYAVCAHDAGNGVGCAYTSFTLPQ